MDRALANKWGINPTNFQSGFNESSQNPNSNPNCDDSGRGCYTEEQLEEMLLKNLEFLYNEAIIELVALGYNKEVALKAILRNRHCYGGMDVLPYILQNSLAFLNSESSGIEGNADESEQVFTNLRQLEEYSLAGMVRFLQQIKPHLSKRDAMWCLLMNDLHMGRGSTMEIPSTNSDLCRFHGRWGFGTEGTSDFHVNQSLSNTPSELSLQKEIGCPKRLNLTPSMKLLLKSNVAMFACRIQSHTYTSSVSGRS